MYSCCWRIVFQFQLYHKIFQSTALEISKVQEAMLFTVALSADGDKILTSDGNKIDAIKPEH